MKPDDRRVPMCYVGVKQAPRTFHVSRFNEYLAGHAWALDALDVTKIFCSQICLID